MVKPADLIPELQGRFPIRTELDSLGRKEFVRILTEPKNALLLQYMALLRTEGVDVVFEDDAVSEIARMAEEVNNRTENIGARRLHTLMERLLEDILFDAPDMNEGKIVIDKKYVEDKLKEKGYEDFVEAEKKDSKIEVLSEMNNVYRTLAALPVSEQLPHVVADRLIIDQGIYPLAQGYQR